MWRNWTALRAARNRYAAMDTGSETTMAGGLPADRKAGDERCRVIVDAAYDLLDEAGLEGLTIRAVLARTGLARRAFYDCFAGKDDLVLAVFEQTLHAAAAHFRSEAQAAGNPLEAIRTIVAGIVIGQLGMPGIGGQTSDRRSAALSREHLRLADSRPDDLQAALGPLLDLIAEQVTRGIRTGQLRDCDADLQARLIYNLVATTVHTELLNEDREQSGKVQMPERAQKPDRAHREALAESLWEFCRRAIIA